MKPLVLILFGPTASGKTEVLNSLFSGGARTAEVISADSMQVYRGMDIGTAKPSPYERARIPHHLIDIRNPDEQFNAGEFVRLAEAAAVEVAARGALPVVSGGTGFYLKNLVLGLGEAPPADPGIRAELAQELAQRGAASLMEELAAADPASARRIHINDEYRLLRALEVCRLTGRPLSSFASPWSAAAEQAACGSERPFRFALAALRWNRDELYRRINARTAAMFAAGLPAEVRRLHESGYTPADPGLKAIGYREFFVQDGESGGWRLSEDFHGVQELVAQNSRRYAKRQITFFASIPAVTWIDCEGDNPAATAAARVQQLVEEALS
ncbi:MAG: tRNA (adenosine(37)-N6)-dimethylallyltransferase MiaA [Treponema sp.]|nr:tRNA (adenosine(37)-N6)-dimethylallyltransferase MiaA [Treponema sp.]